jgi:hypothetical protein
MRNRVKIIRCHSTLFAEGYGSNGDVFPGAKSYPGLLMLRVPEGVEVSATGRGSFLVPWGNIKSVDLYEETSENKVSQAV